MLPASKYTTLTLTPYIQLHPKETRERAAQNPDSNPMYSIAPKRDERVTSSQEH
jgi:hypothetical protein